MDGYSNKKASDGTSGEILAARICDLMKTAERYGVSCTGFLDLGQQSYADSYIKNRIKLGGIRYFFYGGYRGAERRMLVFCDTSVCSDRYYCELCSSVSDGADLLDISDDPCGFSVCGGCFMAAECIELKVVQIKGSGYTELDHRAFMGAVLSLGLSRSAVGDIIVEDGRVATIITARAAAELLLSQPPVLTYVGRDKVKVTEVTLSPDFSPKRDYIPVHATVASPRLDAVVSALTGFSREKAKKAILHGEVTLNSLSVTQTDTEVGTGDVLSVHRCGKFRIESIGGTTRSGRFRLSAMKYR